MQAVSLLNQNPNPNEAEIVAAMEGNLCRCMAYKRIKAAVQQVADQNAAEEGEA